MSQQNIFQETLQEYCSRIGHTPERNRLRHNVETRAAFANAVNPFFHHADVANLFGMERTSVYHYIRNHEVYYLSSPDYRKWFVIASEIVHEKVDKKVPLRVRPEGKRKINTHEQIDTIKRTIEILERFLHRFQYKIAGRKAKSLQDSWEGGLPDDEGHMGSGEVHSVLRDEQLQVQDESGKKRGAALRDRHSKGAVV
jgi:hypothetical protein